jgi:redox-sensing transcriptional repressor
MMGKAAISSVQLAETLDINDAQVRKDLAAIGHLGKRGIGYDVPELSQAIRKILGLDRTWKTIIVGYGNLGRALTKYHGFNDHGFEIVGIFDNADARVGVDAENLIVEPFDRIEERLPILEAEFAILTVPASAAQEVATRLCNSGIRGLMTFAPVLLKVPKHVKIVAVDLSIQLEQLAFLVQTDL